MPGPINGLDPTLNRPFSLPSIDPVATRSVAEPEPLGPDVLFGNRYQPGEIGSGDVWAWDLKDTPLTATLASLADQQPDTIKNAIRYDPATGGYLVRFYDPSGRAVQVPVSRAEIADNIRREGASRNDDLTPILVDPVANASSIWPSVIETAYAKVNDGNWSNGLSQGYDAIQRETTPDLILHALTGNTGEHVGYRPIPWLPKQASLDALGTQVQQALLDGRPALIETKPESRSLIDILLGRPAPRDGLNDNQTLTVTGVHKDKNGDWQVTIYKQSGYSPEESSKPQGVVITVPLEKLVDTGGLKDFVLGPITNRPPGGLFPWPNGGPGGSTPGGGLPTDPSILV